MLFNFCLGLTEVNNEFEVVTRNAAKCVAYDAQGNLLMIRTNRGDYKFPGGGMKHSETLQQTLKREIEEETGFILSNVLDVLGVVEERNIDKFDESKIFVMHSEYVMCEVDLMVRNEQNLDVYEKEQDFKVEFVSIEDAIKNNMALLESANDVNPWLVRETEVLKCLLDLK